MSEILRVASALLNTMGVSAEWFGALAGELGISRPAIYNYAADRSDLLFKCYRRSCEVLEAALDGAINSTDTPVGVIDHFLGGVSTQEAGEIAVLMEVDALPERGRSIIRSRWDALVTRLSLVVEAGVISGALRQVDPGLTASAIVGAAGWAPLSRRWSAGAVGHDAEVMREILFNGIAADRNVPIHLPESPVQVHAPKDEQFGRAAFGDARKEAILAAASMLFNRRGIGATRVEDVAGAIGLNKRAVYHYVGQKDVLVEACIERSYQRYLQHMEAMEKWGGTRLEAMCGAIRDGIRAGADPDHTVMVPHVGFGLLSPHGQQVVNDYSLLVFLGYKRIFEAGQREGSIRALPVDAALTNLPSLFYWVASSPFGRRGPGETANEVAMLIAHGMLA